MEILFAQLIVSPAATEQRQMYYVYALSLIVERQWYDAAGVRTHDIPVVRRTLYWLSQHTGIDREREREKGKDETGETTVLRQRWYRRIC